MSEIPMSSEPKREEKHFSSAEMMRALHELGARQLYEEKTGEPSFVNGCLTEEAQEYVDRLLRQIDYDNRGNWRNSADLERSLMEANIRFFQKIKSELKNSSGGSK